MIPIFSSSLKILVVLAFDHAVIKFPAFVRLSAEHGLKLLIRRNDAIAPAFSAFKPFSHDLVELFCLPQVQQPLSIRRIADNASEGSLLRKLADIPNLCPNMGNDTPFLAFSKDSETAAGSISYPTARNATSVFAKETARSLSACHTFGCASNQRSA